MKKYLPRVVDKELDELLKIMGAVLITGSSKPSEGKTMHTGTGRISRIMMRPMSLYESNESNGKVSLKAILKGEDIEGNAKFRVAQEYVKSLLREELKL